MIFLVGCAGSAAVVGSISRFLLRLKEADPTLDSLVGGEDTDSMQGLPSRGLFVTASHQTGLNTKSMTRRSILIGVEGKGSRARAETRTPLDYADHHRHWKVAQLKPGAFQPRIYP